MTDSPRFSEGFYEEKIQYAREKVAQAWCKEKTKHKDMDPSLAEEFAKILIQEMYAPHLGCAMTKELIDEVKTRIEMDGKLHYMTITNED